MEKKQGILTKFKEYSVVNYKWNLKNINSFNDILAKINANIDALEYDELKTVLKELHFVLNGLKNIKNKFNPKDIKDNVIKLSSSLFDILAGNKIIRPENISLILNAFDHFEYTKSDLYNNTLSINILINIISTIVLDRGNSQNISNTLRALYHFGFTINELNRNGFDLKLLFKAINNSLNNTNSIDIIHILDTLYHFGFTISELNRNGFDLKLLFKAINNSLNNINSINIINILNTLYNFGFTINEMVQNGLDIKFLFYNINNYILLNKKIKEIIIVTDILAKFRYNREKLIKDGFNIYLLCNIVNQHIFKSNNIEQISELFYNLTKFGYNIKILEKDKINVNTLFGVINYKILKYGSLKDIKIILKALSNINYTTGTIINNRLNTILLFCTINNFVLSNNITKDINDTINILFDFGYKAIPLPNNFNIIKKDLLEVIMKDELFYINIKPAITNSIHYLTSYKNVIHKQLKTNDLNIELLIDKIIENISLCNNIDSILTILKSLCLIINNNDIINNISSIIDESCTIHINNELETFKIFVCNSMEYLKYNLKLNMKNQLEIMLKDYKINDINTTSIFEYNFKNFIYSNIQDNTCIKIVQDKLVKQEINNKIYVHRPNFLIIDNNQKYIIDLDEVMYISKEYQIVNESIINNRNNLMQKYCDQNNITYITISEDKFNLLKSKTFKNFKQFLKEENIIKKQDEIKIDVTKFNFKANSFVRYSNPNQIQNRANLVNTYQQLENSLNDINGQIYSKKKNDKQKK